MPPYKCFYGSFDEDDPNNDVMDALDVTADMNISQDSYNVPEGRKIKSYWVVFNIVNNNLGIGVLVLPFAIYRAGMLTGLVSFLLSTAVFTYVAMLFVECIKVTECGHYQDILEYCFGPKGRTLYSVLFCLQMGFEALIFQEILLSCIQSLFMHHFTQIAIILLLAVNQLTVIPNFSRYFDYLSTVSSIAMFCILSVITYSELSLKDLSFSIDTKLNWIHIPQVLGVACFIYRHSLLSMPNLYMNMKHRKSGAPLMPIAYCLVDVMYSLSAILSIGVYSHHLHQTLVFNILNADTYLIMIFKIILLAMSFSKYALAMMPIMEELSNYFNSCLFEIFHYFRPRKDSVGEDIPWVYSDSFHLRYFLHHGFPAIFARILGSSICWTFASTFRPSLYDMVLLIGALHGVSLSVVIPLQCYSKLFQNCSAIKYSFNILLAVAMVLLILCLFLDIVIFTLFPNLVIKLL